MAVTSLWKRSILLVNWKVINWWNLNLADFPSGLGFRYIIGSQRSEYWQKALNLLMIYLCPFLDIYQIFVIILKWLYKDSKYIRQTHAKTHNALKKYLLIKSTTMLLVCQVVTRSSLQSLTTLVNNNDNFRNEENKIRIPYPLFRCPPLERRGQCVCSWLSSMSQIFKRIIN
jgi:hypothetical protein